MIEPSWPKANDLKDWSEVWFRTGNLKDLVGNERLPRNEKKIQRKVSEILVRG